MGEDILSQLRSQDKYRKLFTGWSAKEYSLGEREKKMIEELESLNQQINKSENLIIGSFDYRDMSLAYFTENIFEVSGLPVEYFKAHGLDATMSMFHPDDREEMTVFHEQLMDVYKILSLEEKKTFGCRYTYRWIHRITNEHIWQMSNLMPYIVDEEGHIIFDLQIVVRLQSPPTPAEYNWEYHYTADNGAMINVKKEFQDPIKQLTKREYQVAKLIAQGLSSMGISEELGISHNTVVTHRKNILKKLKINNSFEIVKVLMHNG
jgi:DNA-binding CsgD family transcriptional regulator